MNAQQTKLGVNFFAQAKPILQSRNDGEICEKILWAEIGHGSQEERETALTNTTVEYHFRLVKHIWFIKFYNNIVYYIEKADQTAILIKIRKKFNTKNYLSKKQRKQPNKTKTANRQRSGDYEKKALGFKSQEMWN